MVQFSKSLFVKKTGVGFSVVPDEACIRSSLPKTWIPLANDYSVSLSGFKPLLAQEKCIRSLCREILTAKKSELLFLTLTPVVVSEKSLCKPIAAQDQISRQDRLADLCRIHGRAGYSCLYGKGQKRMVNHVTVW